MGKIRISKEHCKACMLCANACPRQVLAEGSELNSKGYKYIVAENEANCVSCAICAMHCPDMAISVYKEECV